MANLITVAEVANACSCSAKLGPVWMSGVSDSGYSTGLAVLDHQRHDIKIDKTIFWIKNFHVTTDRSAPLRKRHPIETSDALVEASADGIADFESKQFAGRIVEVGDASFRICHDDSFLDGVENRFEKTFLLGQAQKIILHLFRPDASESLD